ncbi:MAG: ATP-binding protein [Pseudomonadota bacterium]
MPLVRSLSGRLLIVTICVVMLIEVAVFVPSVARYRMDYLSERVRRAEIAALTVLAAQDQIVSPELEAELIDKTEVLNIAVRHEGIRELVLSSREIPPVVDTFDLRDPSILDQITEALARLFGTAEAGVIHIRAHAPADMGKELEITLDSRPMRAEMIDYGLRILRLSLIISLITAAMVFFSMRRFVVRPITKVIQNVKDFSENPEDPARVITPRSRLGEIADAERALADMQRDVLAALRARARLAALGEAVAKISHDLRNILATTQLMADRLEMSEDPVVARTSPKLIASLDRAIRLCQSTLTYGKAEEAPPELRVVALRELSEEVCEGLGIGHDDGAVKYRVDVGHEVHVRADPEQLYRVLSNLASNAARAIQQAGQPGEIVLNAEMCDGQTEITVSDTGPGMPAKALENLFKPFRGSTSREGTGLGLAIAQELVQANGGTLALVSSTTAGTRFRITLPSAAAMAAA